MRDASSSGLREVGHRKRLERVKSELMGKMGKQLIGLIGK